MDRLSVAQYDGDRDGKKDRDLEPQCIREHRHIESDCSDQKQPEENIALANV